MYCEKEDDGKRRRCRKSGSASTSPPIILFTFFRFSFLVLRALSWRREAAPLVYRQGTSNSQMAIFTCQFCDDFKLKI